MEQYKRILLKEFDSRQKVITELTELLAFVSFFTFFGVFGVACRDLHL